MMSDETGKTNRPVEGSAAAEGAAEARAAPSGVWGLWNTIKQKSTELESTVGGYLAEAPDNVQFKSKLAEWGQAAGKYLDAADEKIGEMEQNAGSYLKNLGGEIKTFVETQANGEAAGGASGRSAGPAPKELFNSDAVAPSRLEQQLHKLHTDPSGFKGQAPDTATSLDTKTLTAKYPELQALYDKLVPSKMTANKFWNEYEELRKPILEQDEKRKKILTQKDEDDEDEGWGSSGDE